MTDDSLKKNDNCDKIESKNTDTSKIIKEKKHNGIISFWKFMFSMLIVLFHCNENLLKGNFFAAGRIGVEFFFLTSGYLMAKKALNNKNDISNIGIETTTYIWRKIKSFFPYIIVPFIITIFVKEIYQPQKLVNSIWNLTFLDMSGVKSTAVIGQTWYISAMLISMLILYPLIRRYKSTFTHIIAPIIVITIGGWMSHKYGSVSGPLVYVNFIYKGLLRAIFEISLGTIIYEIAQKIKSINFTKLSKFLLTIVEIVGFVSIFFIVNIKNATSKYEFVMILILTISISLAVSEKTIFYNISNNKLCYYLEKLSLPIYLNHIWIILLVGKHLKNYSFGAKTIISVVLAIAFSIFIMWATETVQKIWNKKKKSIKKFFIVEGEKI